MMKRVWVGVGIGLLLVAVTVYSLIYTIQATEKLETELKSALDASQKGNWQEAADKTEKAKEIWKETRPLLNMFHPHDPLELIESSLEALGTVTVYRDLEYFHVRASELMSKVVCLRECDQPLKDNIL